MALFTTENQTSAYYKDPEYYTGNSFVLGLLGYKKNGQKSTFGKIKDVALPIIGGIAGTIIGGPAGAKIGAMIGQGANAATNRAASNLTEGSTDTAEAINNDLTGTLARGNLGLGLSTVASGITGGVQAGQSAGTILKNAGTNLQTQLPDIASGLAGAIGANGQITYPQNSRVRYFKKGGEATPGFASRFALERAKQGAGGIFEYNGKQYTTNFKEEVDGSGNLLPEFDQGTPTSTESIPAEGNVDLSKIARKKGVDTTGVSPVLANYINQLPSALRSALVITSGVDSAKVHAPNSRHHSGNALDLRFNKRLYDYIVGDPLAKQMGLRTIDPNHGTAPHIHLEYDGKTFKRGGESSPIKFKAAGTEFSIDKPTDYKVYGEDDNTEDLIMFDKVSGQYYGQMRVGERIFDQTSNLFMKAVMQSSASDAQKKAALGEHLFTELGTHSEENEGAQFAEGGEAKPKKRYDSQKVFSDLRAHNERLISAYQRDAADQNNAYFKKQGDARAKQIVERAKATIAAIDRGEIDYDPATHTLNNRTSNRRYDLNRLGGYYNETGFYTNQKNNLNQGAGLIDLSSNGAPAAQTPTTQPVIPTAKPAPTPTVQNRPPVTTTSSGLSKTAKRASGANPEKSAVTTRPNIATPQPLSPSDDLTTAFTALTTAKPADKIGDPLLARVPGLNDTLTPTPQVAPTETPSSSGNTKTDWGGSLMDLGRVALGATMASQKTPAPFQPSPRYLNWMSSLEQGKDQGYSPEEWNSINGQIADNYSAGVNALTNGFGSGASPGMVLAGLTRLNQVRGQQTQAAAVGDVARRAQRFGLYSSAVGTDLALDRQQYDDNLARVTAGQQAGAGLVQSALGNIEQRQIYDRNYGPNSNYQRMTDRMIEKENQAIDLIKTIRENVKKNGI